MTNAPKSVSDAEAASPESTISILMQRVIQSEGYGGQIACQAGELRVLIESRDTWRELARVLEAEVKSLRAFKAGVDEALNSGDGSYRPRPTPQSSPKEGP